MGAKLRHAIGLRHLGTKKHFGVQNGSGRGDGWREGAEGRS